MSAGVSPAGRRSLPVFSGYAWAATHLGFAGLLTIGNWANYSRPWVVVVAVLISGVVGGVPLSKRWFATRVGWSVPFGWLVLLPWVGSQIQGPVNELSVLWPAASATLALGLLAMVGGWRVAWAVTIVLIVEVLFWDVSYGLARTHIVEQLTLLIPVVAGTIYRTLARRARRRETEARRREAEAVQQIAALASQEEARADYRTRLLAQVGPILERIESSHGLTPAERAECRLVEASLRDAIRGRGLASAEIVRAARAARERGTTVSLIDDRRADEATGVPLNILAAVSETLDQAGTGDTFVARLLPVGRRNIATVLLADAEGEGVRRQFASTDDGAVFERV